MPLTPPADPLFYNKYGCLECLGQGNEGVVWKAEHRYKNKTVAIKVVDRKNGDVDETSKILKEARILESLSGYDYIVQVDDVDVYDNFVVIAMGYCSGGNLQNRLKEGKVPVEEALNIIAQIVIALRPVHALKLFHRDIKPQNILFDKNENVKLSDFGVTDVLASHTFSTTLAGTLPYMSLEMTGGATRADERADFWSLGVLLYEMLTGVRPFVIQDPKEAENPTNWHRLTTSHKSMPIVEFLKDEEGNVHPLAGALQGLINLCFLDQSKRFQNPQDFLNYLRNKHLYNLPLAEEDFVAIDRFTCAQNYIADFIATQLNVDRRTKYSTLLRDYKALNNSACSDAEFSQLFRFADRRNDVIHLPQTVRQARWVPSDDAIMEIERIAAKMTGRTYVQPTNAAPLKFHRTDRAFVPIFGRNSNTDQANTPQFYEAVTKPQEAEQRNNAHFFELVADEERLAAQQADADAARAIEEATQARREAEGLRRQVTEAKLIEISYQATLTDVFNKLPSWNHEVVDVVRWIIELRDFLSPHNANDVNAYYSMADRLRMGYEMMGGLNERLTLLSDAIYTMQDMINANQRY